MTNLDVMKQALTAQINNLSAPDFERVMDTIIGLNDNADKNKLLFNDTHLLSCANCRKILGECHLKGILMIVEFLSVINVLLSLQVGILQTQKKLY